MNIKNGLEADGEYYNDWSCATYFYAREVPDDGCFKNGEDIFEKSEAFSEEIIQEIDEDWDYVYVSKDQVKEHTFWQYTEEYENVYDTVDEVIEYIEDHMEVPDFNTYKKSFDRGKTHQ